MTMLAAVIEPDCVLMAADGQSTDSQREPAADGHTSAATFAAHKLHAVPGRSLVWGSTGVTTPKDAFGQWLAEQVTTDWSELESLVTSHLAEVNGGLRETLRASFGPVSNPFDNQNIQITMQNLWQGIGVMIGGYLGPDPGIIRVDDRGQSDRCGEPMALFFGPFSATALTSWNVVNQLAPDLPHDPQMLDRFMTAVCGSIPGLTVPVDVWRVTPDNCIRIA